MRRTFEPCPSLSHFMTCQAAPATAYIPSSTLSETFGPPRLAIPISSELWRTLTTYYLDQTELVRDQLRAAAIYALLSLLHPTDAWES